MDCRTEQLGLRGNFLAAGIEWLNSSKLMQEAEANPSKLPSDCTLRNPLVREILVPSEVKSALMEGEELENDEGVMRFRGHV